MAPKAKDKKPSRITVACNACRSRKQKCSGEKPVCEQCYEYHRLCDWPEQLRRGPAKGYIETLEHRLQVTENVLLKVLCQISDAQLSVAIPQDKAAKLDRGAIYMPFSRLEKKGIEDWSEYPLDTPLNIRKWQQACMGLWRVDSSAVHQEQHEERDPRKRRLEGSPCLDRLGQEREGQGLSSGLKQAYREQEKATQSSPGSNSRVTQTTSAVEGQQHQANAEHASTWHGAPSVSFQQQFLW